jgi:hypothetical protein
VSAANGVTTPTAAEMARAAVEAWLQRLVSDIHVLCIESDQAFDFGDVKWAIYERLKEDERLPGDDDGPLEHGHLVCALNAGYLLGVQIGQRIRPTGGAR